MFIQENIYLSIIKNNPNHSFFTFLAISISGFKFSFYYHYQCYTFSIGTLYGKIHSTHLLSIGED
jgi:hypothetical protein